MTDSSVTRQFSLDELKTKHGRGETVTRADAPRRAVDPEFWASARVVMPPAETKEAISFRVDRDVLDWFRSQGRGVQGRMNAVLRSFMEANKGQERR